MGARVACRAQSLQLARPRSYFFDTKASSAGINQGLTWLRFRARADANSRADANRGRRGHTKILHLDLHLDFFFDP